MPMSMSKKNFTIWIVILVVTLLLVTVGRRLIGFEISSFISSLIIIVASIGSFLILKKK